MDKYFIIFNNNTGSLAVEKYLWGIIRDRYEHRLVTEDGIEKIVEALKVEQAEYFASHRGNLIDIHSYINACTDGRFISVGQMSMSLVKVEGEL